MWEDLGRHLGRCLAEWRCESKAHRLWTSLSWALKHLRQGKGKAEEVRAQTSAYVGAWQSLRRLRMRCVKVFKESELLFF